MSFSPFKITKIQRHDQAELLERLRRVSMLKAPEAYPYQEADLTVQKMSFTDLLPAQRYVLADGLKKVQCLEWELGERGVDLFALGGYVTIWTDQADEPIDVLPPIVEASLEANGQTANIINDGMHRMYVARLEWRQPEVVFIQNLPPAYPYYAYPIAGANCWDLVTIVEGDDIPAGLIKKWHRTQDNKKLYRNFNSAFTNVGGPRGQG